MTDQKRRAGAVLCALSLIIFGAGTSLAGWIPPAAHPSAGTDQVTTDLRPVYMPLAMRGARVDALPPPPTAPPPALPSASPTAPPTPSPSPTTEPGETVFDPDLLIDVEITIDPGDWNRLRLQARTLSEIYGYAECRTQPPIRPYTWFPADVRVNGTHVANVALRKKGLLGSVTSDKPSLKIKFDEYEADQRYAGMRRMTLNNNRQDASQVRQCIAYQLFAAAGVAAPRCNFARVKVNGRDLGIFTHVESVKKPFLARRFGEDGGNLYEGVLADFGAEWVDAFELKTNNREGDRSDLDAIVAALAADDASLIERLEAVVDLDEFYSFWVMETLLSHWDGYGFGQNNFYIYHDPTTERFHFIPWGADGAMIVNTFPLPDGGRSPTSVLARSALTHRLFQHPAGRDRYYARLDDLLNTVWSEPAILAEINRMRVLVGPAIPATKRSAFDSQLGVVRRFVRDRRAAIEAELSRGPVVLTDPPRGLLCRQVIGHVHTDFELEWAGGSGSNVTAELRLGDVEQALVQPSAAVNLGETASLEGAVQWPRHPAFQFGGTLSQGTDGWDAGDGFLFILFIDPEQFPDGGTIAIDGHDAFGRAFRQADAPGGGRWTRRAGFIWDGTITLDQAGTSRGAAVTGTIDADVVVYGSE